MNKVKDRKNRYFYVVYIDDFPVCCCDSLNDLSVFLGFSNANSCIQQFFKYASKNIASTEENIFFDDEEQVFVASNKCYERHNREGLLEVFRFYNSK